MVSYSRHNLYFIDINERKIIKSLEFEDTIWSLDISWDGSKLALGMEAGDIYIYDIGSD